MDDSWLFYQGDTIKFTVPEGVYPPIHTIGDSHVNIMDQVFPEMFISTRFAKLNVINSVQALSLHTAYKAGQENTDHIIPALSHIPEGTKILTLFGEIDCREYLPTLARKENKSIEFLVSLIIEGYTKNFLNVIKSKYRLIVLSPYITPIDHEYKNPFEDIFEAKSIYCYQLHKFCDDEGLLFVDIFHESLKNKWDEKSIGTYFNDTTHLGPCIIPPILQSLENFKWRGFDK